MAGYGRARLNLQFVNRIDVLPHDLPSRVQDSGFQGAAPGEDFEGVLGREADPGGAEGQG